LKILVSVVRFRPRPPNSSHVAIGVSALLGCLQFAYNFRIDN